MPDICCRCGQPTKRLEQVIQSRQLTTGNARDTAGWGVWFIVVAPCAIIWWAVGFLVYAIGLAISKTSTPDFSVAVHMPRCGECSKAGPLEPLQVDYDAGRMRFLVHRDFAAGCVEAGPSKR